MVSRNVECNTINNDVVISGISGSFLNFNNIEKYKQNLLAQSNSFFNNNERNTVEEGSQKRRGSIFKNRNQYDYLYERNVNISRKLIIEKVQEAILDAGFNPKRLKTNCRVFVDVCITRKHTQNLTNVDETIFISRLKEALVNEISHWLAFCGSNLSKSKYYSSLWGFENAYKTIQNGDCNAAIVCSINVTEHLILKTEKLLDTENNDFFHGEPIMVFFLQKKKDARRIYANIIDVKSSYDNCHAKNSQKDLNPQFQNVTDEDKHRSKFDMDRTLRSNHATSTKTDSTKLNWNNDGTSNSLCRLFEIIIAFETGLIPSSISDENKRNPNEIIEIIVKLTLREVNHFAINQFGIEKNNAEILLTSHNKSGRKWNSLAEELPRLVTFSGETKEIAEAIVKNIEKNRKNTEYIGLLNEVFSEDVDGHAYRGYIILNEEKEITKEIKLFSNERRPIWFIFDGLGSQWPTMGKFFMKIPPFAESIRKSHQILKAKNLNLIEIITKNDANMLNIVNSLIGIIAIQIAFIDTLKTLDINPDGLIGFSVGEMSCGYAEGCLTMEETLLLAYYTGAVSLEENFVHGAVAVIAATYEEVKEELPPKLDICTYVAPLGIGVSGPSDIIKNFVAKMETKGFLALTGDTKNIPYHSRYIVPAFPNFVSHFKKILPQPRLRSNKWISTSVPQSEWKSDKSKYLSAEYYPNSFISPIYFDQAIQLIPENAIIIEIGPHAMLQPLLQMMPPTMHNIPLSLKKNENPLQFLLNSFGKIHVAGRSLRLGNLYPQMEYPVSKGTPMISSLIGMDNSFKTCPSKL